ncbi:hypothetical protein HPB52_016265 [Rhipicephalus sanguineus]|uniref:Uncharacterized protein n=1 Tax=Rhipicephalus sanguineus TaxID=34632 RepID=A0A9D4TAR7_RHISA|nr:hypothetical protein HPB52_016265 [Rhipicephalus sanguineus]
MLPRLCPPVAPFHSVCPQACFMHLDAVIVLNGVAAQPLVRAILLEGLPVELHPLAATSTSSRDLQCGTGLLRETYLPLPANHDLQVNLHRRELYQLAHEPPWPKT